MDITIRMRLDKKRSAKLVEVLQYTNAGKPATDQLTSGRLMGMFIQSVLDILIRRGHNHVIS